MYLVQCSSILKAIDITNTCAPEHVEVHTRNARQDSELVVQAGAVFIGRLSAEPLGDFVAGPSHVLRELVQLRVLPLDLVGRRF